MNIARWFRGESAQVTYPVVLAALCGLCIALLHLPFFSNPHHARVGLGSKAHVADSQISQPQQTAGSSDTRFVNPFASRRAQGAPKQQDTTAGAAVKASKSSRDQAEPERGQLPGVRLPISGRVLDQQGFSVAEMPVVATALRLFEPQANQFQSRSQRNHRALTNDDGTFVFAALADGEYTVRTVPVGGGYTRAEVLVTAGDVADLIVTTLLDIEVRGSITDAMGQPVQGAWVGPMSSGLDAAATTDAYGQFTLQATVQEDPYGLALRATRKGYRDSVVAIDAFSLAAGTPIFMDIVMQPAQLVQVSGMLTDASGIPVAGEAVSLQSQQRRRSYRALTDATGFFVFEGVEASTDYRLLVRGVERYQQYVRRNLAIAGDGKQLAVVLERQGPSALSAENRGT